VPVEVGAIQLCQTTDQSNNNGWDADGDAECGRRPGVNPDLAAIALTAMMAVMVMVKDRRHALSISHSIRQLGRQ
jgi:hypothetical protein